MRFLSLVCLLSFIAVSQNAQALYVDGDPDVDPDGPEVTVYAPRMIEDFGGGMDMGYIRVEVTVAQEPTGDVTVTSTLRDYLDNAKVIDKVQQRTHTSEQYWSTVKAFEQRGIHYGESLAGRR